MGNFTLEKNCDIIVVEKLKIKERIYIDGRQENVRRGKEDL